MGRGNAEGCEGLRSRQVPAGEEAECGGGRDADRDPREGRERPAGQRWRLEPIMVLRYEELRLTKRPIAPPDVGFGEEAGVGRRRVRVAEVRADSVTESYEGFEGRPRKD